MLVSVRGEGVTYVSQYEHGALAGELAPHWGNGRFSEPALREPLRIAAAHHDDGWRELDDLPAYNAEAGRPAHFVELPLERTAPSYGRGVDSVYERDPLAGALVAMHWTGLFASRWGLQEGGPPDHPLALQLIAEQEARRHRVLLEAWGYRGLRSEFEASVWYAYEVLQALDCISLALSLLDPAQRTKESDAPVPIPRSLATIQQPPGGRIVPRAPTGPLGEYPDLTVSVPGPGLATLDPWPFQPQSVELALPARTLAPSWLSEAEAARAYREAPAEPIGWTLAAAG